jgi:hypothetical protein
MQNIVLQWKTRILCEKIAHYEAPSNNDFGVIEIIKNYLNK